MWGFTMAHELPYDDPEALRRRLRVRYPIVGDRVLGLGELPERAPAAGLQRPGRVTALDRFLSVVHWAWFMEPHLALLIVQARDPGRFARAARQMAATYDLGCAIYFALPTAPPWWAAEQGYIEPPVEHVSTEVAAEEAAARAPDHGRRRRAGLAGAPGSRCTTRFNSNPWAAMPSLHFATSLMAAIHLSEAGRLAGAAGWAYAGTLGFALVYLGEHYVTDLIAGAALVGLIRSGEPLAEPVVEAVNRLLRRLEAIAT